MRFHEFVAAVCITGVLASAGKSNAQGSPPPALSADAAQVVAGNNQFAFDIYKRLLADSDKNLLVSPYSISTALAMTYAGARGQTAEQMADVLRFTLPADRLHAGFGELIQYTNTPRTSNELRTANRLFGQSGFAFQPAFLNTTATNYQAPLQPVDFLRDPETSRATINQWVSDQTNAKIPELLGERAVTSDTRLVLTNAIYLKARWQNQFDPVNTAPRPFYAANGARSDVSSMFQQKFLRYTEQPGFKMLELPYVGNDLAMVVMLPNDRDGLPALQQSLTPELWKSSIDQLSTKEVNVTLPKFTFDSEFKLSGILSQMGMADAFSSRADFSGIATGVDLSISEVIHKTFIGVDEEGTEAAASTAVSIVATGVMLSPEQPKDFLVDHPFLFALEDLHSGEMLFMGRVTDPGALVAAVPEPATATLFAAGALFGMIAVRRKRGVAN